MACFLVPVSEAIVTTVVQKVVEKREKKIGEGKSHDITLKWTRRLSWLNKMLWGGSAILAFDHIWNGEILFRPPFLTGMENPANVAPMLRELATTGIAMAVFITTVWAVIVLVSELKNKAEAEAKGISTAGADNTD